MTPQPDADPSRPQVRETPPACVCHRDSDGAILLTVNECPRHGIGQSIGDAMRAGMPPLADPARPQEPREPLLVRFEAWQEDDRGGYSQLIGLAFEMAERLAQLTAALPQEPDEASVDLGSAMMASQIRKAIETGAGRFSNADANWILDHVAQLTTAPSALRLEKDQENDDQGLPVSHGPTSGNEPPELGEPATVAVPAMKGHTATCRCDACVVALADKALIKAIVWRLGMNGFLEDSNAAECAASIAVSRAFVEHADKSRRDR